MLPRPVWWWALLVAQAVGARPAVERAGVLEKIRAAGQVVCGVVKEEEDYSRTEDHGNRAAFDLDVCRAVAVAALGPGARVEVRTYPDEPFALKALGAGEVDLVATASPTAANRGAGVGFSAPILQDGQQVMAPRALGARTVAALAGKKVCFLTGSAAEEGLHRYAERRGIRFAWYPFSEAGEMEAALFTGNCDAVTGDATQLANIRGIDRRRAGEFVILPEVLRDDPLAVATRAEDRQFGAVVDWTAQLLLEAERKGITQASVGGSQNEELPLRAAEVIRAVGNRGEIVARDLGPGSKLEP